MPDNLSDNVKELVSIRDGAKMLGVSIDTLRRWDKEGKITSQRLNGNGRYFKIEDLERLNLNKKLSISEASNVLGVSQTTLRRFEKRGLISPDRLANGERAYERADLENFRKSDYFIQKPLSSQNAKPGFSDSAASYNHRSFKHKSKLFYALLALMLLLTGSILAATYFFAHYPQQVGEILGYIRINRQGSNDNTRTSVVNQLPASVNIAAGPGINALTNGQITILSLDTSFAPVWTNTNTFSSSHPIALTSQNPNISISNGGALSITDGTNNLLMLTDSGTTGSLNISSITVSGLGAGVVKSNLSGLLSSSSVNLGTSDVSGVLSADKGGMGHSSYTVGDLIYASGTTNLSTLSIGASNQCLIGGSAPSWGSCGSGGSGINWWNQIGGLLFPTDTNYDFAVGGDSTASALFSYTGIQAGQTLASISGNLVVIPNNGYGGKVGIGGEPTALLDAMMGSDHYLRIDTDQNSNFIGLNAGFGVTGSQKQNFIGFYAGNNATNAYNSNFIGVEAGENATNADKSNFIGHHAGAEATNALRSNFIGRYAGTNATNADNSNFLGEEAGYNATNSNFSNFIGYGAGFSAANAANSIFIGRQAGLNDAVDNTGGGFSILIGPNTGTGGFSNSIALGASAVNTATNQLVIGGDSESGGIQSAYFGNGVLSATPVNFTLNATGGSGTDIAGANLIFAGGMGTGTGNGGYLAFQTATPSDSTSSSPNSLTTRLFIDTYGNVGIGTTNPAYALDVAGDINLIGALRVAGNAGTLGDCLKSSGSIANTWGSCGTGGNGVNWWNQVGGLVYPTSNLYDFAVGGSATTSALFSFTGIQSAQTTASVSGNLIVLPNNGFGGKVGIGYIDSGTAALAVNGNVGIGIVNPLAPLQVTKNGGGEVARFGENQNNSYSIAIQSLAGTIEQTISNTGNFTLARGGFAPFFTFDVSSGNLTLNKFASNVGIGTDPTYKLDVLGDINWSDALRVGGDPGLSGDCLKSAGGLSNTWGSCVSTGVNWWNQVGGLVYPTDLTYDFAVGGNSTASALFSFTGVQTGQTIASVSGNLFVMPNNGFGGNVGIGTTAPDARLHVVSTTADYILDVLQPDNTNSDVTSDNTIGQSFTSNLSGNAIEVDICTDSGLNNQIATLYRGDGTADAVAIGSTTWTDLGGGDCGGGYTWHRATFSITSVTQGSFYTVSVDSLSGAMNYVYHASNPYAGGQFYLNGSSDSSKDLVFRTYVRSNTLAGLFQGNVNVLSNNGLGGLVGIATTSANSQLEVDNNSNISAINGELINDGNFSIDPSSHGWNLNDCATWGGSDVTVTYTACSIPFIFSGAISVTPYQTYQISFDVTVTGDEVTLGDDNSGSFPNFSSGHHVITYTPGNYSSISLYFLLANNNADASFTVDNVSMKQITILPTFLAKDYDGKTLISLGGSKLNNLAVGKSALLNYNASGLGNVAFGNFSLQDNTEGYFNSAFGNFSLQDNTTGYTNNAFGYSALEHNANGNQNNAFGSFALINNVSGTDNNAFGYNTLGNNTGSYNNAFGNTSLLNNISGNNNNAFGYSAGNAISSGSNNTFLGDFSNASSDQSNSTAVGANALVGCSNCLVLGSINGVNGASFDTNVGIGTTQPVYKLDVNGTGSFSQNGLALVLGSNITTNAYMRAGSYTYLGQSNITDAFMSSQASPLGGGSWYATGTWTSQVVAGSGIIDFYTNEGSANDTITPNSRMHIDLNGNVGVATINPSFLLEVNKSTANALVGFNQLGTGDIFTASASGTNRFVITQAGNVGIATTTPRTKLDVVGNSSATSSAIIENSNTAAATSGLAIKMGATTPDTTTHLINFLDKNGAMRGNISFANSTTVAYKTSGIADFAEYLKKDPNEKIEWGSILCQGIDGYIHSCDGNGTHIVGVASQYPTFVGGVDKGDGSITAGLSGVVLTKVSNIWGDIKSGDYITSSQIQGVGVKQIGTGEVVGIALEDFPSSNSAILSHNETATASASIVDGKILVRVNPSWQGNSSDIPQTSNLFVNASINANALNLPSNTDNLTLEGLTVNKNATISGNLRVKKNILVEGILNVVDTITTQNIIISGFATFFQDVVFKGNVDFAGKPTFNSDSVGVATIKNGNDSVKINFPKGYADVPIVTASIFLKKSDNSINDQALEDYILKNNIQFVVANVSADGFNIKINQKAAKDINFSWHSFAQNNLQSSN